MAVRMPVRVKINDHSAEIIAKVGDNIQAALHAMGTKAVKLIVSNMKTGYGKPIRKTGDLMRDVEYETERSGKNTVDVGNSLEYAPYVHEGTYKMAARHYIKDALENGRQQLEDAVVPYMKNGF